MEKVENAKRTDVEIVQILLATQSDRKKPQVAKKLYKKAHIR
jgi:hypothetical protein